MVPYYGWRLIPSTFWRRLPTHADLFHYQPDTPSCCQHDLLWRYLLRMFISVSSALHSPRHGRWFYVPTSIRFIARKRRGHIHTLLQPDPTHRSTTPVTTPTRHSIHRLRNSNQQRSTHCLPWGYRKRLLLSLYSVYLAKDTKMLTSDILQREQRHHPACTTSSSSTTCTTAPSWRRMAQRTWRHRRSWQRTRHNIVHRLCDRVLGWRTPLFMEPLPDRGTPHHQPPGRLAQQDQEESSPFPPKHSKYFKNYQS